MAMTAETRAGQCERCARTVGDGFNPGCPHGAEWRRGPRINVPLLDRLMEQIEAEADGAEIDDGNGALTAAGRWLQADWRALPTTAYQDSVDTSDEHRCESAFCAAGWTAVLDHGGEDGLWAASEDDVRAGMMGQWTPGEPLVKPRQLESAASFSAYLNRRDDDTGDMDEIRFWWPAIRRDQDEGDWREAVQQLKGEPVDRSVVHVEARASRLLGFDDVLRVYWPEDSDAEYTRRQMDLCGDGWRRQDWLTAMVDFFDGSTTLGELRVYARRLRELDARLAGLEEGSEPAG